MAADETQETFVIALANASKDYISVVKYDVGRLLSSPGDLAEVSFHRQRCYMHKSKLYRLNGEERALVNTFKRIEKAHEAFTNALKCEPPKCYLVMCVRFLNGVGSDLKDICEEASKEIDKCCAIVHEWLTEIEQYGQIHYEKGAQHFYEHIDNVMRILARNIARRVETRSWQMSFDL